MMRRRHLLAGGAAAAFTSSCMHAKAAQVATPQAATVRFAGGASYEYDSAAGVDIGGFADAIGPMVGLGSRFTMSCVRVSRRDCPLIVDFRSVPGWSCVRFHLGDFRTTAAGMANLGPYTVTISGQTISVPGHWWFSRWRWQSGPWPFPPVPVAKLVAERLIPAFDKSMLGGGRGASGPVSYTPMGLAGLSANFAQTGERPEIGPVTDWQASYLLNGTEQDLANVLAQGEAGGTIPWFPLDTATGALIDGVVRYPGASLYGGAGSPQLDQPSGSGRYKVLLTGPPGTTIADPGEIDFRTATGGTQAAWTGKTTIPASGSIVVEAGEASQASVSPESRQVRLNATAPGVTASLVDGSFVPSSGISADTAHQPAIAYLPYVLTGDPYFLETLQCQAMYALIENPRGFRVPGGNQMRAMAWNLRSIAQAAAVTPPTPPRWLLPQSVFKTELANYVAGATAIMNDGSRLRSVFHVLDTNMGNYDVSPQEPAGTYTTTWQQDFMALEAARAAMLHPEVAPIAAFVAQNLIARLSPTSGWNPGVPEVYLMKVIDNSKKPWVPFASWAEAWAANKALLGLTTDPTIEQTLRDGRSYDYITNLRAALAMISQARKAGVAGLPDVSAALAFVTPPLLAGIRRGTGQIEPKWAIAA